MKSLSVAIPCYNSADYVNHCVDSLLCCAEDVEIIIVDDGSTDATPQIADKYANDFPQTVKVVHQPNGGHGEAINSGLKVATGRYFRVVDSDDWVDESALKSLIEKIKTQQDEPDMFITNYVYTHTDGTDDHVIEYRHEFKNGKATVWKNTRKFRLSRYLTLHSSTFKTELLRSCGVVCPKHTFYEDNYFVYVPLKHVETFCYLDVDLYRYFIGREGQSVQSDVLARRYAQQLFVSELVFCQYNLAEEIKLNKKRGKCLYHHCRMLMCIATASARLNGSEQAEKDIAEMWQRCIAHDKHYGKKMRYRTPIAFQMLKGKGGRHFANFLYGVTRKIVKN